ncbi:MAG: polysaccharide deacetylase family protein [Chloroflexota bacterium]
MSRLRRLWPVLLGAVVVSLLGGVIIDRLVLLEPLSLPALSAGRVANGVTFLGSDLSGYDAQQLSAYLRELAPALRREPSDARVDPDTKGLIPDLYGQELDVDSTIAALLTARPGSAVSPAFRPLKAAKTLADLPPGVIYRGHPAKNQIALAINVAWGDEYLPGMLAILEEHNVKATFFFVGSWANKNRTKVQEIAAAGHEVASHGYAHLHLSRATTETIRQDTAACSALLEEITRRPVRLFSPAYGEWDARVPVIARELGLTTVLWSIDTVDWKKPGVEAMTRKILTRAHNGAVILMHPTDQTEQALAAMIEGLQEQGFALVTISELLSPVGVLTPLAGWKP